jgi:hypothetical protein
MRELSRFFCSSKNFHEAVEVTLPFRSVTLEEWLLTMGADISAITNGHHILRWAVLA